MRKVIAILTTVITLSVIALILSPHLRYSAVTKETTIAIQPFGNFSNSETKLIQKNIKDFYKCKIEILQPIGFPNNAFVNIKSPRYRADTLIRFLRKNMESKYNFVIGLTNKDISTTKYSNRTTKTIKEPKKRYRDWGIFGLGFMPGKSCIVSTYRLKDKNFKSRFTKICCHELGHNFGLPHCPNKTCIMQDAAETIKTIDGVDLNLCESCKKKIGFKD